ncbi:hypothetical protein [Phenylobacterium sp.]|uniref:hypothetical protein n=1 Tax=Phenylobacterium sp. TaxID=1871053 RepID=UPI00301DB139
MTCGGHDIDNPLPEASFFWRRLLTFGASVLLVGLLWFVAARMPAGHLLAFAQGLMTVIVILWVLYFGGASADDVGRLVASVRLPFGRGSSPAPDRPAARTAPPPITPGPPWERR